MSEVHVHICGHSWGIGIYNYKDENGETQRGYGLFRPENPNDFTPDYECCTEEEIQAWKADCLKWNADSDKESK